MISRSFLCLSFAPAKPSSPHRTDAVDELDDRVERVENADADMPEEVCNTRDVPDVVEGGRREELSTQTRDDRWVP